MSIYSIVFVRYAVIFSKLYLSFKKFVAVVYNSSYNDRKRAKGHIVKDAPLFLAFSVKGCFKMIMKIAAFTRGGELASIKDCAEVLIFKKQDDAWIIAKKQPFRLEGGSSSEIRDIVRSLILELDNCSVVVSKSIAGIPYHVFDRMGFSVFEAAFLSDELLDDLLQEIELGQKQISENQASTEPIPLDGEGRWFLDLISLQEKHPEISTKQALRAFIQKKSFLELTLLCTHLPPWLDVELPALHLGYSIESQKDGRLMVTISHTICKE